jgi:hypothetical protein
MMELYSPSGSYVTMGGQIDWTFTTAGTYTLLMKDAYNANSEDYFLTWQRTKNPCNPTVIGSGQVIADSLSIAEIDVYTFAISAGDNVVLTLTKTSGGLDPYLELFDSSGTRIAYQYTQPMEIR